MTLMAKRKDSERSNLHSALLIVADPEGYGGEVSLAVRWARTVLFNQSHVPLSIKGEKAA